MQLAFLLSVGYSCLPWLCVILFSFSARSVQLMISKSRQWKIQSEFILNITAVLKHSLECWIIWYEEHHYNATASRHGRFACGKSFYILWTSKDGSASFPCKFWEFISWNKLRLSLRWTGSECVSGSEIPGSPRRIFRKRTECTWPWQVVHLRLSYFPSKCSCSA